MRGDLLVFTSHNTWQHQARFTGFLQSNLNFRSFRSWRAQLQIVAPDQHGDHYPLTPCRLEKDVWMAWQFDRPEAGEGMVQAFRREESSFESARFRLKALILDALFAVTELDTGRTRDDTSRELMNTGVLIALLDRPGSALLKYRRRDHR